MSRSSHLFEGLTFFLQYLDRRKDAFFEDIRLIKEHGGYLTRFPMNSTPTHVIVDIPLHPRFHTYSLPARLAPCPDPPPTWSLDQIMNYYAGVGSDSSIVVVQRQWITDCIKLGKILTEEDEWGGWRVRLVSGLDRHADWSTRQRRSSPESALADSRPPDLWRRIDDPPASGEWERYYKRTRPDMEQSRGRSRWHDRPPADASSSSISPSLQQRLTPKTSDRTASNTVVPRDAARLEQQSPTSSPGYTSPLTERLAVPNMLSLQTRMSSPKSSGSLQSTTPPLTVSSRAPDSDSIQPHSVSNPDTHPVAGGAPASSEIVPGHTASVGATPKISCQAATTHPSPAPFSPLPIQLNTDNKQPSVHEISTLSDEEKEAVAYIKDPRLRLRSIISAREGRPTLTPPLPPSATIEPEATSTGATEKEDEKATGGDADDSDLSSVETSEVGALEVDSVVSDTDPPHDTSVSKIRHHETPRTKPGSDVEGVRSEDLWTPAEASLLIEILEEGESEIESNDLEVDTLTSDPKANDSEPPFEDDPNMNTNERAGAVSPVSSPTPEPSRIRAPARPEGVFELFSFGLTRPLSFFVTDEAEPGISRMISMAGGKLVACELARFIVIPGNVGSAIPSSLSPITNGDGVSPCARIVHEQWIKHCFRDECILNPDDYLPVLLPDKATHTPERRESTSESDDDVPAATDAPPEDAMSRIEQIIQAVREWKAGTIGTNYTKTYNFVDNLARMRGITNASALYRQHRAYIARVAPDVARPPK